MPTRIVREGILTSKKVNSLSEGAELFYRRLFNVADDYGRYYADVGLLRAACYPRQLQIQTDEKVSKRLAECVKKKVICLYGAGEYIQVLKFNQQTRCKSKFPEPSEAETLIICEASDNQLISNDIQARRASDTTPPPDTTPDTTPIPKQLDFPEFHAAWDSWLTHLKQKKSKPTQLAIIRQLADCVKWGAPYCITVINHSIAHNWKSLFEPKRDESALPTRNGNGTHAPRQRWQVDKDIESVEKRIMEVRRACGQSQGTDGRWTPALTPDQKLGIEAQKEKLTRLKVELDACPV